MLCENTYTYIGTKHRNAKP